MEIRELTDKQKAQMFDRLIDNYCESVGVYECIDMLRCELDLEDDELQCLHFTLEDIENSK